MKIHVQRKVEVWVCDTYEVEEITPEIIQDAINYELDCEYSETLWETQIDLGPIDVLDENLKTIYSDDLSGK